METGTPITTLTKRMAEDLTDYLDENGVRVRYLHSDIDTVERVEIIRDLRLGAFDVLVGINLLREGHMPEVSLVAIFDADKEGHFDQNEVDSDHRSRCSERERKAILYADRITDSMQRAMTNGAAQSYRWPLTKPMALSQRLFARPYLTSWKARGTQAAKRKVETRRHAAAKKKGDIPVLDALLSPDQVEQQIVALENRCLHLRRIEFDIWAAVRQDRVAMGPLRSNPGRPTHLLY